MIDHSPLSELDVSIVGGDVRIMVPLRDRLSLREFAPILRRLAFALEFASKNEELSHRQALLYARTACEEARIAIKAEARKCGHDVWEGRQKHLDRSLAKEEYARKANGS